MEDSGRPLLTAGLDRFCQIPEGLEDERRVISEFSILWDWLKGKVSGNSKITKQFNL